MWLLTPCIKQSNKWPYFLRASSSKCCQDLEALHSQSWCWLAGHCWKLEVCWRWILAACQRSRRRSRRTGCHFPFSQLTNLLERCWDFVVTPGSLQSTLSHSCCKGWRQGKVWSGLLQDKLPQDSALAGNRSSRGLLACIRLGFSSNFWNNAKHVFNAHLTRLGAFWKKSKHQEPADSVLHLETYIWREP